MFVFLNLASLVLGLIAWILPVISLMSYRNGKGNGAILSVISMTACAISLCFQILYGNHLIRNEDWSALMDTTRAVTLASIVLLTVTIILNAIALIKRNNAKHAEKK